jgi:hypothetical protein
VIPVLPFQPGLLFLSTLCRANKRATCYASKRGHDMIFRLSGPVASTGRGRLMRIPEISSLFWERHKTTDKCGRDTHRKLIRFSEQGPHTENSYVIAESRPARRPMRKVSSGCCVNRTIFGIPVNPDP